jgi:acetoin utilization protein AcuC
MTAYSPRGPQAAIVAHPDFVHYDFGPYHPLRPERISAGLDLLLSSGLWNQSEEVLTAPLADVPELELVHAPEYIRAVDKAGSGSLPYDDLTRFGLGSSDNPPFSNMHYAASLLAGGGLVAARAVMSGDFMHAFHPAGGLHHAHRTRASGFCVYNDPAVAAAAVVKEFGARVLYIDLDCHHGDGVQWIFYNSPDVFTLSFHESGRFLFPGTGDVTEIGDGPGEGYSLNVPFAPFTRDASWQDALGRVLSSVAATFRPDLIISNHGCDTHTWDPITHLSLSTSSFVRQAALCHELAHSFCEGRWVAVGSGGYDWQRVVPRAWAILWCEMSDRQLPDRLPPPWVSKWLQNAELPIPEQFLDPSSLTVPSRREQEIDATNAEAVELALRLAGARHVHASNGETYNGA